MYAQLKQMIVILFLLAAFVITRHRTELFTPPDLRTLVRDLQGASQDPRVRNARVTDVVPDSLQDMVNHARKTVRRGKYDRSSGVMNIGLQKRDGSPLPDAVVRGIVVHELAHAALDDGRHSAEWRDLYISLLRVATEQLGWDVALECSACSFYGVCHASQCPRCAVMPCRAAFKSTV